MWKYVALLGLCLMFGGCERVPPTTANAQRREGRRRWPAVVMPTAAALSPDGKRTLVGFSEGPRTGGNDPPEGKVATLRRSAFGVGLVAGGRARGVDGVLVQALPQVIDLLLEGLQPLLILLNEGEDCRPGSRRYLVPELNRDRRNRRHSNTLRPLKARTSSGREQLPWIIL
jgi:hypothetical protein